MSRSTRRSETDLARHLLERHPDEAAKLLETSPVEEVIELLAGERAERAARLIGRLTPDMGAAVLRGMDSEPVARVLTAMYPQRAAALLSRLDPESRESRLASVGDHLAGELSELMQYPPDSAGHLMDPLVTAFSADAPVRDVVRRLRTFQRRRIQDLFLVDADGRLCGSVALQDVVLASPGATLGSLAESQPVSVQATSSRDAVREVLEAHRVGSLPVVDFEGKLLGVLRQEQLIRAAEQNLATDLVTMVGAGRDERALSPPLFAVRKRLPWLQINLLTAFLAASVVGLFEGTIAKFTALAVLLPVVAGQSGNTGAQALAVTMRGLALREIRTRHWLRVGGKELIVGSSNGVAVALTTALAVYVWSRSTGLAMVIGVSMVISMTMAGLAGAAIPMLLTALRQDPAQSSSIVLTTVTDVVGFFSFLGIATLLVGML